mmetsp:Transcript_15351/g.51547  ORF Transcript_15351/g.51547 Transcript_15351/m.51547 type:complete len:154 (-) Transcript_15351:64-525(-)
MLEDTIIAIYRQMLPAIPWLTAIKSWSQFPALSLFFASVYLFIKVKGGIMTAQFANTACNALFRNKLPYGQLLKDDEANNSPGDGECAICQSDLHAPVKLVCGHIFCDDCVMQWLERSLIDGTCPLCRQVVQPAAYVHISMKSGEVGLLPHLF